MTDKNKQYFVPQLTDSEKMWRRFIRWLFDEEIEAIMKKINSDIRLKNVKVPEQIREKLWKQIRDK